MSSDKDKRTGTWTVKGSGEEIFFRPPPSFFLPWECGVDEGERRWVSRARGALLNARALLDGLLHNNYMVIAVIIVVIIA